MSNTGAVVGIILVVVLVVLLLGGAGMMGFGMMGPGMMGGYGGMMGRFGGQAFGFSPLGAILSLVFWGLIIAGIVILVVWFVRNAGRTGLSASSSDPALEILKARYAKGEINKEQYEEMRRTLAP